MPPDRPEIGRPLALGLLALALAAPPAGAQERLEGRIGVGAGLKPDHEGADTYEATPIAPVSVRYRGFGLRTAGRGVQVDVSGNRVIDFGPLIQYRAARDDDVDDAVVRRLPEVDAALEVGGYVEINLPFVLPGSDAVTFIGRASLDVVDAHGGVVVTSGLRYSVPVGDDFRLSVIGTTTFASEDYNEAYFGVSDAAAAASGLPAFDAGAGFKDVALTAAGTWYFHDDIGITLIARYKRLIGDAGDSPVVRLRGTRDQFLAGIALSVRF